MSNPGAPDLGTVNCYLDGRVVTVQFAHPKGNSLPASLLQRLAEMIDGLARDPEAAVIVLRSAGGGTFCAGASFDELRAIRSEEDGTEFFSGFARLILAMRRCPKLILARVQGKVVGGGVGIVAASDYSFALAGASVRLSEIALGLGPFVIGPAVERRIGLSAFSAMAMDAEWRDASWCERHGLYTRVLDTEPALDSVLPAVASRLAAYNPAATRQLKRVLWEGTDDWETLLFERAAMSGRLAMSDHTRRAVEAFAQQGASGEVRAVKRAEIATS
jgi:enoyl-CoA hydratase/carnithine racemase